MESVLAKPRISSWLLRKTAILLTRMFWTDKMLIFRISKRMFKSLLEFKKQSLKL